MLYMRRGKYRPICTFQCICIPVLSRKVQIRIHRFASIIDQSSSTRANDSQIADVTSAVQDGSKLAEESSPRFCIYLFVKKIRLHILVAGDQIRNIFHVIYIGINVLIHLPDNRLAVFRRILKNRSIGKTHGHTGNDHNCTEDQNGYRGKNNTLDTFELPYDQSRKTVFFHLRFSLAYSVGVHPVAFLKEIPK